MWPTSARWADIVRQSRNVVVTAEVWRQGVSTGVTLDVVDGSIRVDETSKVRRSGTLTISSSSDPALSLTGRILTGEPSSGWSGGGISDASLTDTVSSGDGLTDGTLTDIDDGGAGLTTGTSTATADFSGTAHFSTVDTLMPYTADDFLSPVTTDILVSVGHKYTEGDVETVPVIMGRISTVSRSSMAAAVSIDLADYSSVLARSRFVGTWVSNSSNSVTAEIAAMVHDVLPWVEVYDLTGTTQSLTQITWEKQRWEAIVKLASSIGAEAYFDPLGRLIIRPIPDGTGPNVWTMDTDTETAIIEDASVALDMDGVYNAVAVSTSKPDTIPVTAIVYQTVGPLRWQDGFKVIRPFSSPILLGFRECEAAAASILARSLIYAQKIEPTIVPDPALEVGDVGTVLLPGRAPETRILAGHTIPLSASSLRMPCALRTALGDVESTDDMREIT